MIVIFYEGLGFNGKVEITLSTQEILPEVRNAGVKIFADINQSICRFEVKEFDN